MISLSIACAMILAFSVAEESPEEVNAVLTPENITRVEQGDMVVIKKGAKDAEGHSMGRGRVIALIDRSPDAVWQVLIRAEEYPQFMPRLVSMQRYYDNGNQVGLKETIKVLFSTISYHVMLTLDPASHTLSWHLDHTKENDIRDTTGSWTVRPHGEGKSLVVYSVAVDSGMHVPRPIESFFFNKDFPGVVRALKKRVESGAGDSKTSPLPQVEINSK